MTLNNILNYLLNVDIRGLVLPVGLGIIAPLYAIWFWGQAIKEIKFDKAKSKKDKWVLVFLFVFSLVVLTAVVIFCFRNGLSKFPQQELLQYDLIKR